MVFPDLHPRNHPYIRCVCSLLEHRTDLGDTHEGDLGVGEAGGGDGQVVEHVGAAAHVLHGADALRAGATRSKCQEQAFWRVV